MMGISATDGICQVPVMWIISSLARVHFRTSNASAQNVVWCNRVLRFLQLLQVFVACRLILCTTSWTALYEVDLTASEKCLCLILANAIRESREVCCCCICMWSANSLCYPGLAEIFTFLL